MNDETIDLRELVEMIWKGKIVLIVSIVAVMIIAAFLSVFVLEKKYESNATVQITSNTAAEGIVKQYIDSEFTSQVFAEKIKSQTLKNEVNNSDLSVNLDPTTSMISLSYTSGNSEKSRKVLDTLINEQKIEMTNTLQNEFKLLADSYTQESKKLSDEIRDLIKLYNSTVKTNKLPEILILQAMVENQLIVDLTLQQQESLVNVDGELQNDLMQLQARIESKSIEYRKVLDQYQSVMTSIESFRPDPLIKTIIEPTLSKEPSSPNILFSIAIGLVIGTMIGLGIVIIRKYWEETSPKTKKK